MTEQVQGFFDRGLLKQQQDGSFAVVEDENERESLIQMQSASKQKNDDPDKDDGRDVIDYRAGF